MTQHRHQGMDTAGRTCPFFVGATAPAWGTYPGNYYGILPHNPAIMGPSGTVWLPEPRTVIV